MSSNHDQVRAAYFFLPEEFMATLSTARLRVERLFGCNGLGAHLEEDNLLALMADRERWTAWLDLLLATCDHPNIVGVSKHLLAVAYYGTASTVGDE